MPRAGASGTGNVWGRTVTIDADGLRENGRARPSGTPILVLGDSFTFGDEVDDADTWPAQLEARLGRPVLNGGVFGYGLDQMVLRGEQLLDGAARASDVVILSVLPEDVLRCEFSYRYAWKPYFAIEGGRLALRNVPVPQPHEGPPGESLAAPRAAPLVRRRSRVPAARPRRLGRARQRARASRRRRGGAPADRSIRGARARRAPIARCS